MSTSSKQQLKPTIVSTTYVTTAQDNIQGIDVYTTDRNTPINNILDAIGEETSSFLKSISGMIPDFDLLDVVAEVTEFAVTGKSAALDRINDLVKTDWTSLTKSVGVNMVSDMLANVGVTEISPELLDGLLGVPGSPPLDELLAGNIPAVRLVLNESVQALYGTDYVGAQGLVTMLNTFVEDDDLRSIFDGRAQEAFSSTLINTARNLGLSDVYENVVEQIPGDADKIVFYQNQLPAAAEACDIVFIHLALAAIGNGRILQAMPNIISRMLKGYRKKIVGQSHHDAFAETLELILMIDEDWSMTVRGGQTVLNLEPFTTASNDAIDALKQYDEYRTAAAIAGFYPPTSITVLAQSMWKVNTIQ